MIIFLYGPDTYRSRRKLNEIIEYHKKTHKSGLNLKFFEGKELNFQDFKDELQQASMFKEKKLMVLTNVFLNLPFKEEFLKKGKNFVDSEDIILFYETGTIPERDSLFNFLIKHAKSQEFKPLEDQKLKNWAKKEFESYQANINSAALDQLINYIGNDLWHLSNEIKKLVSYKKGQKIEVKDVELLVRPKIESDIFTTIDAMAERNKKIALSLVHKHLEKGDSPLYLLSMINFQFRNLLMIKDLIQKHHSLYLLSKMTNLHPYIIKKSYSQAQKFTTEELKKIYQKIFQVDLAIKTGKVDPETGLDLLITEI